ncbi:MAG: L-fucose/L-arabinose isomerase family protein [Planctomycetota bacterium]
MKPTVIAVIVGHRNFFPERVIAEGRREILGALEKLGAEPVILPETQGKLGAVETYAHAKVCAELFRAHRERIDGVLITLPNFGDEKAIADAIRLSGLEVPILVHAFPDDLGAMGIDRRRDAFCGKISVCNNLRQYGYPFSLTELHTVRPSSESFERDLRKFLAVARVVRGMRRARIGALGARPNPFNTTRYSEKLLEASGVSVTTADLSEILGRAQKLADSDPKVRAKVDEIRGYAAAGRVPGPSLALMAKLAIAIADWMDEHELVATAIQCWSSLQDNYGVNACTVMSMMGERLLPSACEVDVTGAAAMYALTLASGTPSALVDWNNNYAGEPDKCVLFHCGNWPKSFVPGATISAAEILETVIGGGRTWGTLHGRTPAGPVTFARITTDDRRGAIRSYVAEGEFTDDPLETFGSRAVVHIPDLQGLLRYVCEEGFEHHVAMNASRTGEAVAEAFEVYLGWEVYRHAV